MTTIRGAGRPRDERIDQAIMTATLDELIDTGFTGMSMESIASRAGVAKTTLYRRWSNTADLGLAAIQVFVQAEHQHEPPNLNPRDQILWLLNTMRNRWNDPRFAAVMRRLMTDAHTRPEVFQAGRDRVIGPVLEIINQAIGRAMDEGQIRSDLDVDWVRQLITAPIATAALTGGRPISREQVEFNVDIVFSGLRPRTYLNVPGHPQPEPRADKTRT